MNAYARLFLATLLVVVAPILALACVAVDVLGLTDAPALTSTVVEMQVSVSQMDSLRTDAQRLPSSAAVRPLKERILTRIARYRLLVMAEVVISQPQWDSLATDVRRLPSTSSVRPHKERLLARIDRYRLLSDIVPPTASFTYVCEFLECTFTDASSTGSAPIESREWFFGDGSAPDSGSVEQHTFEAADTFWVTLTVVDTLGSEDSETRSIVVSAVPTPEVLDTTAVRLVISPSSGVVLFTGQSPADTVRLGVLAFDSSGVSRDYTITWASTASGVATVSAAGTVTAVSAGRANIIAQLNALRDTIPVDVIAEPAEPDPNPGPGSWHVTLADTTIAGDLVVTPGQRWLIQDSVVVEGNVLVQDAVLGMRAGASLRISGADPADYVGGGLRYDASFTNDLGVWVWGSGSLDWSCTAKTGWNRTGVDASWSANDEYWIAPTALGDYSPRPWSPGQAIPRAHVSVPGAEVVNVTRDCVVKGPGHIHINSTAPSTVEYVRLDSMGVIKPGVDPAGDAATTGRYALHFHMSGTGSSGSVVRGVACVGARGRCFVPHSSSGITFTDNVCVNGDADCLWWDMGHATDDLLFDRGGCLGVTERFHDCYVLGFGDAMEISNSFAAGANGSDLSSGFDWPEAPCLLPGDVCPNPVWTFNTGNVAHNNAGHGLRFWNNNNEPHIVTNAIIYHNAVGIENGAYGNPNRYTNLLSYRDGLGGWFSTNIRPAVIWQTNCNLTAGGATGGIANATIIAAQGPALTVGHRNVPNSTHCRFTDVTFTPAPGQPKVMILEGGHSWRGYFINTNVLPEDIVFADLSDAGTEGTEILIDHADGRKWRVLVTSGQKVVTVR